jgi:hypothetical protein
VRERFALDDDPPSRRLDCELRLELDDLRPEREPALFEPDPPDFLPVFPDRDAELLRAI